MSQVYMTAKLNLADGTILYPQVSLDNIVASISDPTLVSVATTTNGKVPIAQLPVTLTVTESTTTVPTAGAVYTALGTKQATLVEGDNIIHIINGSTIMADITNLDVAGIDQTATNGVHLVLDGGNTISAVAGLVTGETAGVLAGVGDGIALSDGVISANIGSGVKFGASTTSDTGKVVIDEASVETTLQDVRIDGGSTVSPVDDQVLTPGNLRGALSVGQAVDVSCAPYNNSGSIVYVNDDFLQGFTATMVNGTTVGFYDTMTHRFPKFADNLVYLFIANVSGSGTVTPNGASAVTLSDTPQRIWTRVTASDSGYISASANATMAVTNWRQYEVTALTDEAIAYIAQLPDPDAFFRAASVYSLRDKYLVKQDMVCPFIPTISMPDNSDLTVAAGLSYKIKYTNDSPHIITADTIPTDAYGWDTHVQMFIKGTSSVVFQQPLILMDALTPNAGHNLSIKWRNGDALVYVDDTNIGYVVTVTSGTESGSLYYGLTTATESYIVFSNALDTQEVITDSAVVTKSFSLIGNGPGKTVITGSTPGTSIKKTENNWQWTISLQGIRTDCTFWASNGASGNVSDCIFDSPVLSDDNLRIFSVRSPGSSGAVETITGSTFANFTNVYWGGSVLGKTIDNCLFYNIGNSAGGSSVVVVCGPDCSVTGCTFSSVMSPLGLGYTGTDLTIRNTQFYDCSGIRMYSTNGTTTTITGCTFTLGPTYPATTFIDIRAGSTVSFTEVNTFVGTNTSGDNTAVYHAAGTGTGKKVIIQNGAVLDLSEAGNTYFIKGSSDPLPIEVNGTAYVIPYQGTEPYAISGTGNTLLNNGRMGYMVTSGAATTASGTLYDALVGGGTPYSNVIFDPALEGSTVSVADGATSNRDVVIDGNGTTNTIVSGNLDAGSNVITAKNLVLQGAITGDITVKDGGLGVISVTDASTLTLSGTNIINSTVSGSGTAVFADGAVVDLSGNSNSSVISGGTIAIGTGVSAIFSAVLDEVGATGTKTVSMTAGSGAAWIMRENGSVGIPVTSTDATGAGTLAALMEDKTEEWSAITFSPAVDGGTFATSSDTTAFQDHRMTINGAGWTKTTLAVTSAMALRNAPDRSEFRNLHIPLPKQVIHTTINGVPYFENCLFDNTSACTDASPLDYYGNDALVSTMAYMVNCKIGNFTGKGTAGSTIIGAMRGYLMLDGLVTDGTFSGVDAVLVSPGTGYTATTYVKDCTLSTGSTPFATLGATGGKLVFQGINKLASTTITGSGVVEMEDGATIDFRGNTNQTVITASTISVASGAKVTVYKHGSNTPIIIAGPTTGTTMTNQGVIS